MRHIGKILGQTKIGNLGAWRIVQGEQDILGFNVTVTDSVDMEVLRTTKESRRGYLG
jgi:hypothetical protein